MRNQVETQKERSRGISNLENFIQYLMGRGSENNELHKSSSKYKSITFYRSPGMRIQVEKQKERSRRPSIQQNFLQYLLREGGCENNELQKYSPNHNLFCSISPLGCAIK